MDLSKTSIMEAVWASELLEKRTNCVLSSLAKPTRSAAKVDLNTKWTYMASKGSRLIQTLSMDVPGEGCGVARVKKVCYWCDLNFGELVDDPREINRCRGA